jgi:hypothetical protein
MLTFSSPRTHAPSEATQERSAAGNVALPRQPRERQAPSSSPISVPGARAGAASAQAFGGRLPGSASSSPPRGRAPSRARLRPCRHHERADGSGRAVGDRAQPGN